MRGIVQTLPLLEVYRRLKTGPDGLSQAEAQERLKIYGKNILEKVEIERFPALAANFTHLMALLLWAGGLIAFLAGLLELGVAIWMVNQLIWTGIAAELAIVLSVIYLPPLQLIFKTVAFPLENWLYLFAWMPSLPLADEIRKAMLRRRKTKEGLQKEGSQR